MWSDYRSFAICPAAILGASNITADTNGFVHLIALEDAVLSNIVLRYPKEGITQVDTANLAAGSQLGGIKSVTVDSGLVQVLYFQG